MVDANHAVAYLQGTPLAAEIITADGQKGGRAMITGTTPMIDTGLITCAVAMRERDGDAMDGQVTFPVQEVMEDTGTISAFTSGNLARAKYQIPTGAVWTMFKGIQTDLGDAGLR